MLEPLPDILIEPIVRAALAEDLGRAGDITSAATIDADARLTATFASRNAGAIAGLACARIAVRRSIRPPRSRRWPPTASSGRRGRSRGSRPTPARCSRPNVWR